MRKRFDAVATVRRIRDSHYRKFRGRPLKEWFDFMRSEADLLDQEITSKERKQMSHKN